MVPPLEIFRVEADGALVWCECADSLEIAVQRIGMLMATAPAEFVVVSLKTGHRRVFGGPASENPSHRARESPLILNTVIFVLF